MSPGLEYAIFEPSGDQAGERPRVSRSGSDPSGFMSQISSSPLGWERNAIRVPSGDQVASNSGQGDWVSRVRSVPSALTDQTSSWLSKTMRPVSSARSTAPVEAPGDRDGDALAPTLGVGLAPIEAVDTGGPDGLALEAHAAARTITVMSMVPRARPAPRRSRFMPLLQRPSRPGSLDADRQPSSC